MKAACVLWDEWRWHLFFPCGCTTRAHLRCHGFTHASTNLLPRSRRQPRPAPLRNPDVP